MNKLILTLATTILLSLQAKAGNEVVWENNIGGNMVTFMCGTQMSQTLGWFPGAAGNTAAANGFEIDSFHVCSGSTMPYILWNFQSQANGGGMDPMLYMSTTGGEDLANYTLVGGTNQLGTPWAWENGFNQWTNYGTMFKFNSQNAPTNSIVDINFKYPLIAGQNNYPSNRLYFIIVVQWEDDSGDHTQVCAFGPYLLVIDPPLSVGTWGAQEQEEGSSATQYLNSEAICPSGAQNNNIIYPLANNPNFPKTGGNGVYSYQWQQSINSGGPWNNITGSTDAISPSYTPPSTTGTRYYRVQLNSSCAASDQTITSDLLSSNVITVTNYSPLNVGKISGAQSICNGQSASPFSSVTPASGGSGQYSYTWNLGTSNTEINEPIASGLSTSYPNPLTTSTYFQRAVTDNYCNFNLPDTSNNILVNVYNPVTDGTPSPLIQSIDFNTVPSLLTVSTPTGGIPNSYTYQWQTCVNPAIVSNWNNISGATGATYQPGALTQTTYYRREVINACNTAFSSTITVNINGPLNAGVVDSSQNICYNAIPNQLAAYGYSGGNGILNFQWQDSLASGGKWVNIPGANQDAYTPNALNKSYYYRFQVSDGVTTAYTNSILVNVYPPVTEGTLSASQAVCYNSNASTLTVTSPSGGNGTYSYVWLSANTNYGLQPIQGATQANYTPTNLTANTYFQRQVTSGSCGSSTSNIIEVSVYSPLTAGNVSSDQTVNYAQVPLAITCGVATGGVAPYLYQWQVSTDGTNFNNISSATTLSYSPGSITTTTYYRLMITCACGTIYSNTITINVYGQLSPGIVGYSQNICFNSVPSELVGSNPSGGNGTYVFQWESSTDGTNFMAILGETGAAYTPPALTTKMYYLRQVTSNGVTVNSNIIAISVEAPLQEGTLTGPQTICDNTSPSLLTATSPSGGNGPNSYVFHWNSSTDGYTFDSIPGVQVSSYTPPPLNTTTYFQRVVRSGACGTATSNSVKITVYAPLTAGLPSPNQTVPYNFSPTTLSCQTPTGGDNSNTFQWQQSYDNFSWQDIYGATNATYLPGPITQTTYFRQEVISHTCGTALSGTITITVLPQVTAGVIMQDESVCYGSIPNQLTGTNPTGGNGNGYNYQWYSSINGGITYSSISGAVSDSYQPGALTQTTLFERIVTTTPNCGTATSNYVTITVAPQFLEGNICPGSTICYGSIPNTLTATYPTGSIPSQYTFQWQSSTDNNTWTNIPGATQETYTPFQGLTENTFFRRSCTTQICGTVYTSYCYIQVYNPLQEGAVLSGNQSICFNSVPSLFTLQTPTGGDNLYTFQWEYSLDQYNWYPISGATGQTYQSPADTVTTYYRRSVTSGNCGTVHSNIITVNVDSKLTPGIIGYNNVICYNTVPYQIVGFGQSGGTGSYSFQWYNSTNASTYNVIIGATDSVYNPPALTATTYYKRTVKSGSCGTVTSNVVEIQVPGVVKEGTPSPSQNVCFNGTPALLTCTTATGGLNSFSWQWQSCSDNVNFKDIPGAVDSTFQPGTLNTDTFFRRSATSGSCGTAYSQSIKITVNNAINAGVITSSQTICNGNTPSTFTGTAPSGGSGQYFYRWQVSSDSVNFVNITNATLSTYNPGVLTTGEFYRRIVSNSSCGSDTTNVIHISILPALSPGSIFQSQSICYGSTPFKLIGTNPSGGNQAFGFQWQASLDSINYYNVNGITINYQPDSATQNIYYRRQVLSENCTPAYSNDVLIKVLPQINANTISQNQDICFNAQPSPIGGPASTGGQGSYSYQWQQKSIGDSAFNDIPGQTALTYLPNSMLSTQYFRRVTTSGTCGSANSNTVAITVMPNLNGGLVTGTQTICYNTVPNILSDSTLASGGTGAFNYQWDVSVNKNTWTPIANSNNVQYLPGLLTQTLYYQRLAINTCGTVKSNILKVSVLSPLQAGQVIGNQSICYNMTPSPIQGSLAFGADNNYTYQWQESTDSLTWNNIYFNGLGVNYSPDSLQTTTYYQRIASSVMCVDTSVISNVIKVVVSPLPLSGQISGSQSICYNTRPLAFNGTVSTGGTGTPQYTWEYSTNGSTWNNIYFYGDSVNYRSTPLTTNTLFRRETNMTGCKPIYTNNITVSVLPSISVPYVNYDTIYCKNSVINLTANDSVSQNFVWYDANDNVISQGKTLTIDTFTVSRRIYLKVFLPNGCPSDSFTVHLRADSIQANFQAEQTNIIAGNAIYFVNQSINGKIFLWNFYDGDASLDTNAWHFYNNPGNYTVQLIATSPNKCKDTLTRSNLITVQSDIPAGTNTAVTNALQVYPNPVTDFLTIVGNGLNIQNVTITDMSGKILLNREYEGFDSFTINVSFLNKGIYLLSIKTDKSLKSFKLIKI